MNRPPAFAHRLLLRRLAADEREEILGDLNEQFHHIVAARGVRAARRWYWRQACALSWGFTMRRRDIISTEHERRRGLWAAGNVATDARAAWRSLKHSRAFTVVALLTVTFGTGLSTAVFSLVRGVLLNPLPYPHAERLVHLGEFDPRRGVVDTGGELADVTIGLWTTRHNVVERLSPYGVYALNITLPSGLAHASVADVGADFFSTVETTPLRGRLIGPADLAPGAASVAVISERLWRSEFGGRDDALGKLITTEVESHVVVGVVPGTFQFPNDEVDVWRPGAAFRRYPMPGGQRQMFFRMDVIGRLRAGATPADAEREGNEITRAVAGADPNFADGTVTPTRVRASRLIDEIVAPVRAILTTLGAGMVLVLAAACVSLANLLLARDTARQRDVAVRLSLGASRWRIARPILFEQLWLAAAGGGGGALLAWWLLGAIPVFMPKGVPRISSIHFDAAALWFTVLAALGTAIAVSVAPVFRADDGAARELASARGRIPAGGATRSADRLRGLLVVMQIALATVLLVGAMLIGRSLSALMHVNPGYRPDGVLVFQAAHPFQALRDGHAPPYFDALLTRLRQHPDVVSAGYSSVLPMRPMPGMRTLIVAGRPFDRAKQDDLKVVAVPISTGYLEAIGNRVVRGRGFSDADAAGTSQVVLIDQALERKFFPDGGAIGARVNGTPSGTMATIVGVTESIHFAGLGDTALPVLYFHTPQMPPYLAFMGAGTGVAVRTNGDPSALMDFVKTAAREIDPNVPLHNVRPLIDDMSASVAQPRFFTAALGLFAALALSTALLGLYGILAYSVERRRQELAVRRALGATEWHVARLVMARGGVMAAAGLCAGLAAAAMGARVMRSLLFGVRPADPASYAVTAVLIATVVAIASWQPVQRALGVDPAAALRTE